ncbi:unnamed protein product [Durusdinium trenchii]|uniref:Kinesin light chain n=1 Tax=Durusdinium trenchii TaxID=1381693 RepID=A0ABP0L2D3_9DINO
MFLSSVGVAAFSDGRMMEGQELQSVSKLEEQLQQARQRSKELRQQLRLELEAASELEKRLEKVRADKAVTRQLIAQELQEVKVAHAKLQEVKGRDGTPTERARQALSSSVLASDTGALTVQRCDVLQQRARALLHGGADLEAAGGNSCLSEAREAAEIVEQLEDLGHGDDALYRALLQFSLRGLERHLEPDDPEVLARVHSLGVSLENLGEKTLALQFYQRAYESRSQRLGSEHRDTLDSGYNLATCYRNVGKLSEAEVLFENVLTCSQRVLGSQCPLTIDTAEQLADLLERKDLVAAWKLRRSLLEWSRSAYGEDDPAALLAMAKLAGVLKRAADAGVASRLAAAEALKASVARHQKVLGAESPEAIQAAAELLGWGDGCPTGFEGSVTGEGKTSVLVKLDSGGPGVHP